MSWLVSNPSDLRWWYRSHLAFGCDKHGASPHPGDDVGVVAIEGFARADVELGVQWAVCAMPFDPDGFGAEGLPPRGAPCNVTVMRAFVSARRRSRDNPSRLPCSSSVLKAKAARVAASICRSTLSICTLRRLRWYPASTPVRSPPSQRGARATSSSALDELFADRADCLLAISPI